MNKILLNILIFVGFQQFILGTQDKEKLETKLGFCLSCYLNNVEDHVIPSVFSEESCQICVKQVYSVCRLKHTMCGQCIYAAITDGLNYKGGQIKCFYCAIDPEEEYGEGKTKFQPCYEPISMEIIEYILENFTASEEREKILEKYNRLKKDLEYKRVLLHPENQACKYEGCRGFFNVTKENFFCNENENHIHCNICFGKKHEGKCKDPLEEYNFFIETNRGVQKQIENKQLGKGMIEGCKPCPNCHKIITKVDGCNHITCGCDYGKKNWKDNGCGYQWCWRCGGAYTDNHWYNASCISNPQLDDKDAANYADDGDYFGIKNGNFEEQFKKLAREGVIDVEVDVTVKGQFDNIKKIDWDKINKGKKDWMDSNPGENYYNEYQEEQQEKDYPVGDSKNCCTECCCC